MELLLTHPVSFNRTLPKLITIISDRPLVIIEIYAFAVCVQVLLSITNQRVSVYIWTAIVCLSLGMAYYFWHKHPRHTIWGYDFRETFYNERDNPGKNHSKYIHRLDEVFLVCMGLQREAGLINPRYKYSHKSFIGILMPLVMVSIVISKLNSMAFYNLMLPAPNTKELGNHQLSFMTLYMDISVMGLFVVLFGIPLWIYYQLNIMEDYWNWKQSAE